MLCVPYKFYTILNIRKRLGLSQEYIVDSKTKVVYFKASQDYFIGMIVDEIDFRLIEGIILPKTASLAGTVSDDKSVIMEEKGTNCRFQVFFIDDWIKPSEFDDVRKVLDSF